MKPGWEVVPLKTICKFVATGPFGSLLGAKDYTDDGVAVVNPADINAGQIICSTAKKVSSGTANQLSQYRMKAGDVVIARRGELGRCAIVAEQHGNPVCGTGSFFARPKNAILAQYLLFFIGSQQTKAFFEKASTGATMPNISNITLSNLPIPLPPLEEQRRIVEILDEAFEGLNRARANAQANLQNARELFAGAIAHEFKSTANAPKKKVGEVANHSLGKMLDKNKNKGIPRGYLRNINVRWFEIDTSDILEMRIEDREVERYSVKRGDLLICEGGYPGRCAIWDQDEVMYFQKALHRVRFEHEVYGRLLMFFLFMEDQSGSLMANFSGSGIQHFTGQALARFEMPYPSPEVAEAMVSKIEAMQISSSELEVWYRAKLQDLDNLRQSLLQKAFAGELT